MTVTAVKLFDTPPDADIIHRDDLRDKIGGLLDTASYYREYDVQAHKNDEAIAEAELAAVVFHMKRILHVNGVTKSDAEVDKIVAAVRKATIATARRMKREEELRRMEREIVDLRKTADATGVTFPVGWFPE